MGLFKQIKDMKDMVEAAPGMMEAGQQAAANAQAQAAQYQAQAAQMQAGGYGMPGAMPTMPAGSQAYVNNLNTNIHGEPTAEALEPINGVSLEAYTAIIKELGARGNDQSLLPEIASAHGVKAADWDKAKEGWGARIKDDRALGSRFNTLYTAP